MLLFAFGSDSLTNEQSVTQEVLSEDRLFWQSLLSIQVIGDAVSSGIVPVPHVWRHFLVLLSNKSG